MTLDSEQHFDPKNRPGIQSEKDNGNSRMSDNMYSAMVELTKSCAVSGKTRQAGELAKMLAQARPDRIFAVGKKITGNGGDSK